MLCLILGLGLGTIRWGVGLCLGLDLGLSLSFGLSLGLDLGLGPIGRLGIGHEICF